MYLYQCYVTGPWKLCNDLVTVKRGVYIPWNPDSQTITISTDSEAGSKQEVDVRFLDANETFTGDVYIVFDTEIQYWLGGCNAGYAHFPVTLPTETKKTWTITYNHTEQRLVLHCNGVQVLNVVLSNSVCDYSDWINYWGRKFTQIEFYSWYDTASDTYCMSSNPGKYNGVIDSGE